jgi:hypothetical protein
MDNLERIDNIVAELENAILDLKAIKTSYEQIKPFLSYEGEIKISLSGFGQLGYAQVSTSNPPVVDFIKDEATLQIASLNSALNGVLIDLIQALEGVDLPLGSVVD